MSVIDNRVVQLLFDNKQFESGIKDSMKSLAGFNKSLDQYNKNDSLSSIASSVEAIASKFTGLGRLGLNVFDNLAQSAINTGKSILKSITIDQVSAGWDKYAEKTTSVQTIMAATSQSWQDDYAKIQLAQDETITSSYELSSAVWDLGKSLDSGSTDSKKFSKELKNLGISEDEFTDIYDKLVAKTGGGSGTLGEALSSDAAQIDYVDSQLAKLNMFSDETSYSFTDMVSNIGKFTGAGQDLSTSVDAMQGIANWAAISGQNASTASRAMYNISQAMGTGAMKAIDWKSIENANMATQEFKQTALETAIAEGKLRVEADGSISQLDKNGKKVKTLAESQEKFINGFRDTLQAGWFDTDVMSATFAKYGEFSGKIMELGDSSDATVTDLIKLTDAVAENGRTAIDDESWNKIAEEMGVTQKEMDMTDEEYKKFKEDVIALSDEQYDLGRKSLKAAQEAKTFSDAIDATKDAMSTAFMNIFEGLFGNYEKSKVVWTGLANFLYEMVVAPLERIQDIMDSYTEAGGPEALANLFEAIGNAILFIRDTISGVWNEIFPPKDTEESGKKLAQTFSDLADKVTNFTASLNESKGFQNFINVLRGLFSALDIVKEAASAVFRVFKEDILPIIEDVFGGFGDGASSISDFIQNLRDSIKSGDTFYNTLKGIVGFLKPFITIIANAAKAISKAIQKIFGKKNSDGFGEASDISIITEKMANMANRLSSVGDVFSKVGDALRKAWDKIKEVFNKIKESLKDVSLKDILSDSLDLGLEAGIGVGFIKVLKSISGFFDGNGLKGIGEKLNGIVDSVSKAIGKISGAMQSFTNNQNAQAFKDFAKGLLILAAALIVFTFAASFDEDGKGIMAMGGAIVILVAAMKELSGIKGIGTVAAAGLVMISVALLLLAIALGAFILVTKDMNRAFPAVITMLVILGALVLAMQELGKVAPQATLGAFGLIMMSVALLLLAGALFAFSLILSKMEKAYDGLLVMAGLLIVMVFAMKKLGDVAPKAALAAVSILVLSIALVILAGALAIFAAVATMPGIVVGALLMVGMLVIVTAALERLSESGAKAVAAAAAILVVSAAMIVLALALGIFMLLAGQDGFVAAAITMAVGLALITAALVILGKLAPEAILGAAAILIVAVALIALSAAVLIAAIAINALVVVFSGILDMIINLGIGIGEVIESIGTGLGEATAAIGNGIGEAIEGIGTGIADAITALIASVGEGIGQGISAIGDGITDLGEGITGIGTGITDFGDGVRSLEGIKWVDTAIGVKEMAGALKQLGKAEFDGSAVSNMLSYANAYSQISSAAASMPTLVSTATDSLVIGMQSMQSSVSNTASNIAAKVRSTASTISLRSQGVNIVQGLIDGMRGKIVDVVNAMNDVAEAVTKSFSVKVEIASPSKVFKRYGEYIDEGLAIGLNDGTGDVKKSMKKLYETVADIMDNDFEQPVIKPTLDLSNITEGASEVSSLFNDSSISASVNGTNNGIKGNGSSAPTISYVQNNYSPQALNRIDIYRNTKNQINSAASAVAAGMQRFKARAGVR